MNLLCKLGVISCGIYFKSNLRGVYPVIEPYDYCIWKDFAEKSPQDWANRGIVLEYQENRDTISELFRNNGYSPSTDATRLRDGRL